MSSVWMFTEHAVGRFIERFQPDLQYHYALLVLEHAVRSPGAGHPRPVVLLHEGDESLGTPPGRLRIYRAVVLGDEVYLVARKRRSPSKTVRVYVMSVYTRDLLATSYKYQGRIPGLAGS